MCTGCRRVNDALKGNNNCLKRQANGRSIISTAVAVDNNKDRPTDRRQKGQAPSQSVSQSATHPLISILMKELSTRKTKGHSKTTPSTASGIGIVHVTIHRPTTTTHCNAQRLHTSFCCVAKCIYVSIQETLFLCGWVSKRRTRHSSGQFSSPSSA